MFKSIGDRMTSITPRGEVIVLALAVAIWMIYVFTELRGREKSAVDRVLWFSLWLAEFVKSVRSDRMALLGNAAIVLLGFLLFVRSIRSRGSHGGLLIPFLMACVLLYAAGTLAWYHNTRNIALLVVSGGLWWAILLHFSGGARDTFFSDLFPGFGWLLLYNISSVLLFVFLFPDEGLITGRLCGPFGINELPRNLLVLLVGLFCRCYALKDFRADLLLLSCAVVLLLTLLTLSRSGMAVLCLFLVGAVVSVGQAKGRLLAILVCVAVGAIVVSVGYMGKLRHRFVETGDGGRVVGMRIMLEEGMREYAFGHGFMKSSIETFQESSSVDRATGYSSHCFYASVFYEFGIVGAVLFASLYLAVFHRLYVGSRSSLYYKFALWAYIGFSLSGLFENTSWWPTTPFGLLLSFVIVTAAGAVRGETTEVSVAYCAEPSVSLDINQSS